MSDFSDRLIRDTYFALVAANAARAVALASTARAHAANDNDEDQAVIDAALVKAYHDSEISNAADKTVNQLSAALAACARIDLLDAAEGR